MEAQPASETLCVFNQQTKENAQEMRQFNDT
jgi:hypothetical protein